MEVKKARLLREGRDCCLGRGISLFDCYDWSIAIQSGLVAERPDGCGLLPSAEPDRGLAR
jgi:hypothetical protein